MQLLHTMQQERQQPTEAQQQEVQRELLWQRELQRTKQKNVARTEAEAQQLWQRRQHQHQVQREESKQGWVQVSAVREHAQVGPGQEDGACSSKGQAQESASGSEESQVRQRSAPMCGGGCMATGTQEPHPGGCTCRWSYYQLLSVTS